MASWLFDIPPGSQRTAPTLGSATAELIRKLGSNAEDLINQQPLIKGLRRLEANPNEGMLEPILEQGMGLNGLAGAIRRPQDIGEIDQTFTLAAKDEPPIIGRLVDYIRKFGLTEKDPIVKYVDEAQRLPNEELFINMFPINREPRQWLEANREHLASKANAIRKLVGTNQTATTDLGKAFEDLNDIQGFKGRIKDPKKWAQDQIDEVEEYIGPERLPEVENQLKKTVLSKYAAEPGDKQIFNVETPSLDYIMHAGDIIREHLNTGEWTQNTLSRMSVPDFIRHIERYDINKVKEEARLAEKLRLSEAGKNTALVHSIDDKTWHELTDPDALEAEGTMMSHCVGSYCEKVKSGNSRIFSLRDHENRPLATMEIGPTGTVRQVFGKLNSKLPKEIMDKYVDPFVNDYIKPIYERKQIPPEDQI